MKCFLFNLYSKFTQHSEYLLVSRFFAFPVNIFRKSWYSRLSWTGDLDELYMFIVEKNDTNSSKSPYTRPPLFAKMSPNLSQVQCGRIIVPGRLHIPLSSFCNPTFLAIFSIIFSRKPWSADLHLPVKRYNDNYQNFVIL